MHDISILISSGTIGATPMIRLWLSRNNSIPVREQLGAQLLFGILSRRIAPGEKLPSVRELARRLKVHPNTVSTAYRDLATRGWVRRRRGSGVYVRDLKMPAPAGGIEAFARAWFDDGLARGFAVEALEAAAAKAGSDLRTQTAQSLLVVHPDRELAQILAAEIEEAVERPVASAGFDDAPKELAAGTCVLVTTACESQAVNELRPAHYRVIRLKSVEDEIAEQQAPPSGLLIAVVSRSESILEWSSKLLSALGLPGTDILQRNPTKPDWREGLAACDIVAADIRTALELPLKIKPTVFRIVADDFLAEARDLVTPKKL
jgi:DNA-binding transcriptional regulator YhcF (GntR family)